MKEDLNALEMVKAYAESVSTNVSENLPPELVASLMVANNEILTAAIIQNEGELVISEASVYKMLTNVRHPVATVKDDGSIKLTLALKEQIMEPRSNLTPL